MSVKKKVSAILLLAAAVIIAISAAYIFRDELRSVLKGLLRGSGEAARRPEAVKQEDALSPVAMPPKEILPGGWIEDFSEVSATGSSDIPQGWVVENKPGTALAKFSVQRDGQAGKSFLRMESDKASGSVIVKLDGVDIKKTPYLRWRWRVRVLPEGADGRVRAKDDQAIGIYIGSGSTLSNKSVSYRWDTETPKDAEGSASYGLGIIKVKWCTLRNKEDAADGRWISEERNVAEDFRQAWGRYPDEIYLSVSCNSQYTGSQAVADLDWIGFDAQPAVNGASPSVPADHK